MEQIEAISPTPTPSPTPTTTPEFPGDADDNGIINAGDITKLERIILGLDPEILNADANIDGTVNSTDIGVVEYMMLELWPWNHVHIEARDNLPYCTNFTAMVYVTYVENLRNYDIDINYNASVLDFLKVTDGLMMDIDPGGQADSYVMIASSRTLYDPGTLEIHGSFANNSNVSGAGYIAQIHFHVNGSAGQTSPIAFNSSWPGHLQRKHQDFIDTTWEDDSVTVAP
jgi:hypothetical protein